MTRTEDLDKELERLSGLAQDYRSGTPRWEILWARIDRLLEERGKLSVEVLCDDNNSV
jgi:hypothetical protein